MRQKKQVKLLQEEIEAILSLVPESSELKTLLREPLLESRRGLAMDENSFINWPLLPFLTCEAVGGRIEIALPVAAALQLLMAAGDVFDDIEDADSPGSIAGRYGTSLACNAATTLLILAERAISRLKDRGVNDRTITAITETVNTSYINACAGQHLDLLHQSDLNISEERYLQIACMKSASQIQCACRVGAMAAGAEQKLLDAFSLFGQNLGVAAQIANDILGITQEKDIRKRKITLPVIYAREQTQGPDHQLIEQIYGGPSGMNSNIAPVKNVFFRTGAVFYCVVKMDLYKQMASAALRQAEQSGASIERLMLFLGKEL
jgi:geranylgeranyl diphosphate synthase, type I